LVTYSNFGHSHHKFLFNEQLNHTVVILRSCIFHF